MTDWKVGDRLIYFSRSKNSTAFKAGEKVPGRVVKVGKASLKVEFDDGRKPANIWPENAQKVNV